VILALAQGFPCESTATRHISRRILCFFAEFLCRSRTSRRPTHNPGQATYSQPQATYSQNQPPANHQAAPPQQTHPHDGQPP
jgi:hypothetical protein